MNKKTKLFTLIFCLFCFYCYAEENNQYYAYTEITDGTTSFGKITTTLDITDVDENTIIFNISKTIDPFSQVLMIEIIAVKGKKKYEFNKIDNWGNEAYGYIKFVENYIEIYLDCDNFSESGKNYSRFYGDTEILTIKTK